MLVSLTVVMRWVLWWLMLRAVAYSPLYLQFTHAAWRKWLLYLWQRTKSQHITFWLVSQSQLSKWCLYGSYFKDNKAREHAGTREIMQSIPDLAYEIPIRNFILRFRPRSSQFHSARYTEHLNLTSWIISWITRSKWLPGHSDAIPRMDCHFHVGSYSAPTAPLSLKVGKLGAHKWYRCSR